MGMAVFLFCVCVCVCVCVWTHIERTSILHYPPTPTMQSVASMQTKNDNTLILGILD